MKKTISEEVFERFCASRGIVCVRVPESETRTPDYELVCGSDRIVVEVKEIARNKEEQNSSYRLPRSGLVQRRFG